MGQLSIVSFDLCLSWLLPRSGKDHWGAQGAQQRFPGTTGSGFDIVITWVFTYTGGKLNLDR